MSRRGVRALPRAVRAALVALACALVFLPLSPVGATTTTAPDLRPAAESLLLVVDFSGSMLEPDGTGSTRIDSAKRALYEIIDALPESLDVGMRAYGHRVSSRDKPAACLDTELVVPVQPLDRAALTTQVQNLQALGETPIGLSLQQAVNDLPKDSPSTIILVSDGADECWPDLGPEPCEVTRQLIAQGYDLRLETIGLQVEEVGRQQLQCMAEAGGGDFTSVDDAGLLAEAIAAAQNRSLRTFVPRGDPIAGGPSFIDATPVGPGAYTDSIFDGETLWFVVEAREDQQVAARLTIRTADVPTDAKVALEWQNDDAIRVQAKVANGIARGQANTLSAAVGELNGSRSPFGAELRPGRYYLAVRTAGFPPDVAHDFVLEIRDGTEVIEPVDSGAGAFPTPDLGQPTEPGDALPSAVPVQSADLPPPPSTSPLPLVVLLVLAALGGAGFLGWRRYRASRDDRPAEPTYT